jgi:predicted ATPase/DNA-binding winged helix-turn-helix (wHTH) protein
VAVPYTRRKQFRMGNAAVKLPDIALAQLHPPERDSLASRSVEAEIERKHEEIMTISASALHPPSLSEAPCPPLSPFKSPADAGAEGSQHPSTQPVRVNGGLARRFSFGPFHLIPTQRLLLEAEKPLRIGSRALDILITLVERGGELVSKEELMARVWPKMFVEPANLTVHVAALRRVLGDGRNGNRYLVNIPGRGYRFVAPVSVADGEMPPLPVLQPIVPNAAQNLRAQVTKLVGRSEALRMLARQLSEERFVTIVGPGGVGKTSVALAFAEMVAADYEHGVWLVDLARLSDPRLVPGALASVEGQEALSDNRIFALVESLRGKQMLLVLDYCAPVIEAAASLAVSILRGAPGVRILATSREPLRVEGERRHRLSPLELPSASASLTAAEALRFSAIELFVQCAAARLDDFELVDRDVAMVVDLCRKLDGLPLAIEFAAGQIDTFGVRGLSARLAGGLQQLSGGYRTALPRHQTLRAMLDSSYDWLPEPERVVFRRLSIFDGEFSMEAANMVAAGGEVATAEAIDHVASLARKSLVTANVFGAKPVYRLLETTRAYALEKLQESREFDAVASRHAECCPDLLSLAEAAE